MPSPPISLIGTLYIMITAAQQTLGDYCGHVSLIGVGRNAAALSAPPLTVE